MTRFCLIPLRTEIRDYVANHTHLQRRLAELVPQYQPDVICLPECTLTGYLYEEADFQQFAEPIPGPSTDKISALAKKYGVYICYGLLEKSAGAVYNTAVLFDQTGQIVLIHQKNNEKPPFSNGKTVDSIATGFGKVSILICGDLFSTAVREKLTPDLDFVVMPMVRSFANQSPDQLRWIKEGRPDYLAAVKAIKTTTLLVNALEVNDVEPSFGGALVVDAAGQLLAESPHGTDDALVWDT